MAFVRKYDIGGSAPSAASTNSEDYINFINKKLAETKFTNKGEVLARDVASNFIKLHESGDLGKVYSYDSTKQEYKIDTNKITDPSLKGLDWAGSKDEINKNIFGMYSGNKDRSNAGEANAEQKKFNTLVAG